MIDIKTYGRVYELKDKDVFYIFEKNAFEARSNSGCGHIFVPIKRYKRVIWYKHQHGLDGFGK